MPAVIRITMFKQNSSEEGRLLGCYFNEEEAKANLNARLTNTVNHPVRLRWVQGKILTEARSFDIVLPTCRTFNMNIPATYFLYADDVVLDYVSKCECTGVAVPLTGRPNWWSCTCCKKAFYLYHCWNCKRTIDSRVNKYCLKCRWYVCSCGAGNQAGCTGHIYER